MRYLLLLLLMPVVFPYPAVNAEDNVVAAYCIENVAGKGIWAISNDILSDELKGENELTWLVPSERLNPFDDNGLFIAPDAGKSIGIIYNRIRDENYRYLVEYRINNVEIRSRKGISIPYLINRFDKYLNVDVMYKILNPQTGAAEAKGSFDYSVDYSRDVQFFEFDPMRADIVSNAVKDERIIGMAARELSAIIISQMRSLVKGGLLALKK